MWLFENTIEDLKKEYREVFREDISVNDRVDIKRKIIEKLRSYQLDELENFRLMISDEKKYISAYQSIISPISVSLFILFLSIFGSSIIDNLMSNSEHRVASYLGLLCLIVMIIIGSINEFLRLQKKLSFSDYVLESIEEMNQNSVTPPRNEDPDETNTNVRDNDISQATNFENSIIDSNHAYSILDRTLGFISNCEGKTSIILGIYGVIFSVIITNNGLLLLKNIYQNSLINGNIIDYILLIGLTGALVGFFIGLYYLFLVLFPRIDDKGVRDEGLKKDSLIFWGSIIKNRSCIEYKRKLSNCNNKALIEDIISQIYINADICNRKFVSYKKGLKLSLFSFMIGILMYVLGIEMYNLL